MRLSLAYLTTQPRTNNTPGRVYYWRILSSTTHPGPVSFPFIRLSLAYLYFNIVAVNRELVTAGYLEVWRVPYSNSAPEEARQSPRTIIADSYDPYPQIPAPFPSLRSAHDEVRCRNERTVARQRSTPSVHTKVRHSTVLLPTCPPTSQPVWPSPSLERTSWRYEARLAKVNHSMVLRPTFS